MKRFAAIVQIDVDDMEDGHGKPLRRRDVIDALKRCLRVDLETEEESPAPVVGVSVDLESLTYYDDQTGKPVVYMLRLDATPR